MADEFDVSLAAARWTLTAPLLVGAIATPVLGRIGTGPRRRQVIRATVGIGVGYPLAGLLTSVSGLPAAYGLGLLVTAAALAAAWWAVPRPPPGRSTCPGAVLLAAWVWRERRCAAPLVDVALLRHLAVAGANVTMLLGGIGMYLLLTLVTRDVQTPESAGYGFGVDVFVAGLVLVPFSALGFAGGKLVPRLRRRLQAATVLAAGGGVVLAALVVFALARGQLWLAFAVMGLLGLGVGAFSAAMPAATPPEETSSAMSVNQVVRSVGFSIGSALGGLVLRYAARAR